MKNSSLLFGVMSGTSLDGIDIVLINLKNKTIKIIEFLHIPYKIFQIEDIPYTINGKKVEIAVRNILEKRDVTNLDALSNPKSLEYYKSIKVI